MRNLQRLVVRRIREGRGAADLTFRCDAPEVRRELDLRVSASPSARVVLFRTSLRSQQRRPPLALLDARAERGGEALTMCGWCDRFRVGGEWVEAEVATERLGLFQRSRLPTIEHGVCDACNERLLAA
jgi:hypothetical protein